VQNDGDLQAKLIRAPAVCCDSHNEAQFGKPGCCRPVVRAANPACLDRVVSAVTGATKKPRPGKSGRGLRTALRGYGMSAEQSKPTSVSLHPPYGFVAAFAPEAKFPLGSDGKFSFSRPAAPPVQTSGFDVSLAVAATFNARFIQSTFLIPTLANMPPRLGQGLAMNSPQRSLEAD